MTSWVVDINIIRHFFIMHSQQAGGPPLDYKALHLAQNKLRHELLSDPRVKNAIHPQHYTNSELFAQHPPIIDPPPSAAIASKSSKNKKQQRREKNHPHFDVSVTIMILCLIPLAIALVLEGIALNQDNEWNDIINEGKPFPDSTYFENKKFVIDTTDKKLTTVKELLIKDTTLEIWSIVLMVVSFAVVVIVLMMYSDGTIVKPTIILCHIPVGLLISVASILIFVSDDHIDKNHLQAASELELFFLDIMDYKHVGDYSTLTLENVEEIGVQTLNLIHIQKLCGLGASPDGRLSSASKKTQFMYLLKDKHNLNKITLEELRELKFCSLKLYKHSAGFLLMFYFIMCYLIPVIYYCISHGTIFGVRPEDKSVFEMDEEEWDADITWKTSNSPPPAFGYGVEASKFKGQKMKDTYQTHQHTFPGDTLTPLNEQLETEYAELSLLHSQALKLNRDDGGDDSTIASTSISSIYPIYSRGRKNPVESCLSCSQNQTDGSNITYRSKSADELRRNDDLEDGIKQLDKAFGSEVEAEERRYHHRQQPKSSGSID